MADTDYIGNLNTSRWQSMNASYLNRTPTWMRGEFKQGNRVNQQRYQAPNAGVSQSWRGGEILDTRTRPGATADAVARIGEGLVQKNLNNQQAQAQAQQQQQAGQQLASAWQNAPQQAQVSRMAQQYASAFKPAAPAPATSLTTGVGAINQNLARWQTPTPKPNLNPVLTGYQNAMGQAAVAPMRQQYTNPGAPPRTFNPTPLQQQAITGVQQMKASQKSTPANKPARTRAQKRGIAEAAFANIRQSLGNQ